MAQQPLRRADPTDVPPMPEVTTRMLPPDDRGVTRGIDGTVWLWRRAPQGSLRDTRTDKEKIQLGGHLQDALDALSSLSRGGLNRQSAKQNYRQIKISAVSMPVVFSAPVDLTTKPLLDHYYGNNLSLRRGTLLGVRLIGDLSMGNLFKTLKDGIAAVSSTGPQLGKPIEDYEGDYQRIHRLLARAGLEVPSADEIMFSSAWWNPSTLDGVPSSAVPTLAHTNHQHFFYDMRFVNALQRAADDEYSGVDLADCDTWPVELADGVHAPHIYSCPACGATPEMKREAELSRRKPQGTITFGAVQKFDFPNGGYVGGTDLSAQWAMSLFSDYDALAVTIDGFCEPVKMTAKELRKRSKLFRSDEGEHIRVGKSTSIEAGDKAAEIERLIAVYSREGAPSTLVDCRITVAFNGRVDDIGEVTPPGMHIDPMTNSQQAALHEMMPCSNVIANPYKMELPSTVVAYAGLSAIQKVGDDPVVHSSGESRSVGAMLGFTERDRQPVYISGSPQASEDNLPIEIVAAGTGSGKTMVLLWLAYQWHQQGYDQIIIDPKKNSDHGPFVRSIGGTVVRISDMEGLDGPFDPIRFSANIADGISLAADMIQRVNPFGDSRAASYYTDISSAIKYGVQQGARSTGAALQIAADNNIIRRDIVDPVFKLAEAMPMFALTFGRTNEDQKFSIASGLTLVMVGDTEFETPAVNEDASQSSNMLVRASANVIRMLIRASTSALSGREAKVHIDEAWMIDLLAPGENEKLGRLVRSMDIALFEYTQTPSNPLNAGMDSYVGRGMLGYQKDPNEAVAGMHLLRLGDQPYIENRVTTPRENPSTGQPNPETLRAYRDNETGYVRGSIFYVTDIVQRMAPVEVVLPPDMLTLASTSPKDERRRAQLAAEGKLPKMFRLSQRTNVYSAAAALRAGRW